MALFVSISKINHFLASHEDFVSALGRGEQPPDILTIFSFAEALVIVPEGGQ